MVDDKIEESSLELSVKDLDTRTVVVKGLTVFQSDGKQADRHPLRDLGGDKAEGTLLSGSYSDRLVLFVRLAGTESVVKYVNCEPDVTLPARLFDHIGASWYMPQTDMLFLGINDPDMGAFVTSVDAYHGEEAGSPVFLKGKITSMSGNSRRIYCGTDQGQVYVFGTSDLKQVEDPKDILGSGQTEVGSDYKNAAQIRRIVATENDVMLLSRHLSLADTDLVIKKELYFASPRDFDVVGDNVAVAAKTHNRRATYLKSYSKKALAEGRYAPVSNMFDRKRHIEPETFGGTISPAEVCAYTRGFWAKGKPHLKAVWHSPRNSWTSVYDLSTQGNPKVNGELTQLVDRAAVFNKN